MRMPERVWPRAWAPLAFLLLAGPFAKAQDQAELRWQEFRSEPGNFLVWVPAAPEKQPAVGLPAGSAIWQLPGSSSPTRVGFGFVAGRKPMKGPEGDVFLDDFSKDQARSLEGSLGGARKMTMGGWPGREMKILFAAGEIRMCLLVRVFLVGETRLFVQVAAPVERGTLPEHLKILDSFKLIDETRTPRD